MELDLSNEISSVSGDRQADVNENDENKHQDEDMPQDEDLPQDENNEAVADDNNNNNNNNNNDILPEDKMSGEPEPTD